MNEELIAQAQAGDSAAIERLIGAYQLPVGRFVVAQTGSKDDYLDLCQTIFVKMVRGMRRLKSPLVFEAWLFQIARNTCTDHLRQRQRHERVFVALDPKHEQLAHEREAAPEAALDALSQAIARLTPAQRSMLELSLEEARSYDELARMARVSVATIRNRLFRARERLKRLVRAERGP